MVIEGNLDKKRYKILIIDSKPAFGDQIRDQLIREGFDVILIQKGSEAVQAIYDNLPRLIVLNAVLPDADSYEIISKKDAEPLLKVIPVLLVSTQGMPINMSKIPQGSSVEFFMTFKDDPKEVVDRIKSDLAKTAKTVPPALVAQKSAMNTKTLLWIEDDKLIDKILSKRLESVGFDLMHAKSGEDALRLLAEKKPKVIMIDLLLPGMSGFEIMQKIDMSPDLKKIPVIIFTNLDRQSDKDRAKMLGAKEFLVKSSTSMDQIIEEINKLM